MGDKATATYHGETEADRTRRMMNDQVMTNHRMRMGAGGWRCTMCGTPGSEIGATPCNERRWGVQDNLAAPAARDSTTSEGTEQ